MNSRHSFPLSGELILGSDLYAWLLDAAPLVTAPVRICSAYMRSEAVETLFSRLPAGVTGKVLVRWRFEDLVRGSSDLRVYELCRHYGLTLFMRQQFHGKVYALPPVGIGTGSANATLSGFGLHSKANDEVCNLLLPSTQSLSLIEGFFEGATLIDDNLFALLAKAYADADPVGSLGDWPSEVLHHMGVEPTPLRLLVDECLWSDGTWAVMARTPSTEAEHHDKFLLGIEASATLTDVRRALMRSPPVRWLRAQLDSVDPAELYFGNLTQRLHSALLDDPGPRRSEVKVLLQNVLNWIQLARLPELDIDRPNHSQRVRLRTGNV
jgi:hypothetical protein